MNAKIKKELQEKGIVPPDKPRLNRKKYIEEAREEWNGRDAEYYAWDVFLYQAISIVLGHTDRHLRASPEAVGVAKTLKLALRLKEFRDKLKAEGRDTYTIGEEYEYIKDILDILGQTLTSDSGGGSYAQSKTHNDVRHDLTVADAKTNYPHMRYPPCIYARVVKASKKEDVYTVTLKILDKNKQTDTRFPEVPMVSTKVPVESGDIVVVMLLYGECDPYIVGSG